MDFKMYTTRTCARHQASMARRILTHRFPLLPLLCPLQSMPMVSRFCGYSPARLLLTLLLVPWHSFVFQLPCCLSIALAAAQLAMFGSALVTDPVCSAPGGSTSALELLKALGGSGLVQRLAAATQSPGAVALALMVSCAYLLGAFAASCFCWRERRRAVPAPRV